MMATPRILQAMTTGPSWDALFAMCRQEGIDVYRRKLIDARGAWSLSRRAIWVDSRLSDRYAAPVLAHELIHAHRGDPGHQPAHIEQLIDERVARMYVDPLAYAQAEQYRGPYAAAIADELDLPQWVVEAWQRRLLRVA